jgi:hypothetical protein
MGLSEYPSGEHQDADRQRFEHGVVALEGSGFGMAGANSSPTR